MAINGIRVVQGANGKFVSMPQSKDKNGCYHDIVSIFTRGAIGNSAAALLMIGVMLPLFFFAMYEKEATPAPSTAPIEDVRQVYVTCSGNRFHREDCYYIEGRDAVAITIDEAIRHGYDVYAKLKPSQKSAGI
jgi:hypothetical protein